MTKIIFTVIPKQENVENLPNYKNKSCISLVISATWLQHPAYKYLTQRCVCHLNSRELKATQHIVFSWLSKGHGHQEHHRCHPCVNAEFLQRTADIRLQQHVLQSNLLLTPTERKEPPRAPSFHLHQQGNEVSAPQPRTDDECWANSVTASQVMHHSSKRLQMWTNRSRSGSPVWRGLTSYFLNGSLLYWHIRQEILTAAQILKGWWVLKIRPLNARASDVTVVPEGSAMILLPHLENGDSQSSNFNVNLCSSTGLDRAGLTRRRCAQKWRRVGGDEQWRGIKT